MRRLLLASAAVCLATFAQAQEYVLPPTLQYYYSSTLQAAESPVSARGARWDEINCLGSMTPGTMMYGVPYSSGVPGAATPRYLQVDAATYTYLTTACPTIFNDSTVTGSITTPTLERTSASFLPIDLTNAGLHRQVVLMIGDSIMDSATGGTQYNGLLGAWNQLWAQPVVSKFVTPSDSSRGSYKVANGETAYTGNGSTTVFTGYNLAAVTSTSGNASIINGTSITVTAGAVIGTDNGSGAISGSGVVGTINYTTGAITLTYTTAPANATAIKAVYSVSASGVGNGTATNPGGKWLGQLNTTSNSNAVAWSRQWYAPTNASSVSRIVYNFGKPGWRCADLAGNSYSTYPTVSSLLDTQDQYKSIIAAPSQQVVAVIAIGTNDFDQLITNSGGSYVSTTMGSAVAPYMYGSPTQNATYNLVTMCVIPMIAQLKAKFPGGIKIVWVTPIARQGFEEAAAPVIAAFNNEFVNMATYLAANYQSLGIDVLVNNDNNTYLTPGNALYNVASVQSRDGPLAVYNDGIHLTPYGYTAIYGPSITAALDSLLPN